MTWLLLRRHLVFVGEGRGGDRFVLFGVSPRSCLRLRLRFLARETRYLEWSQRRQLIIVSLEAVVHWLGRAVHLCLVARGRAHSFDRAVLDRWCVLLSFDLDGHYVVSPRVWRVRIRTLSVQKLSAVLLVLIYRQVLVRVLEDRDGLRAVLWQSQRRSVLGLQRCI